MSPPTHTKTQRAAQSIDRVEVLVPELNPHAAARSDLERGGSRPGDNSPGRPRWLVGFGDLHADRDVVGEAIFIDGFAQAAEAFRAPVAADGYPRGRPHQVPQARNGAGADDLDPLRATATRHLIWLGKRHDAVTSTRSALINSRSHAASGVTRRGHHLQGKTSLTSENTLFSLWKSRW